MNTAVTSVDRPEVLECVESQEWTYGIDNTGTIYNDAATYELTLSDGSTLQWSQAGSSTGWSQQLTEWAANIQQAADDAGLVWFVEPRFVDNYNPANIDGTINGPGGTASGLPGAPTEVIAQELAAGGMAWRYVNFQICPGQPVPVSARRLASTTYTNQEVELTAAGPVLGVVQRFYVCRECGKEPVWYLEDNVTLAEAGQIPNCTFPCGFLSLQPAPPNKECQFQFDTACDNNLETDPLQYTNLITRRVTYCAGKRVAVEYYKEDANDPTSLEPYELVGEYVDCASGDPVEVPPPACERTTHVGNLWRLSDNASELMTVDYWGPPAFPGGGNSAPHDNVSNIFTVSADGTTLEHPNGAPNVTYTAVPGNITTSQNAFLSAVGAASNAETSGNDQIRVRGYVVLNTPARIKDTNPNTGERGGIWINRCCAGSLELLFEDTTDSVGGDTGIFDGLLIPAGIHYIEVVTSDLSAWQGFQLSASYDDGATYSQLPIYNNKPSYDCLPVLRCDDTGTLVRGDVPEVTVVTVGVDDRWCEPAACVAEAAAAAPAPYNGPTAEDIAKASLIAERDSVEGCVEKFAGTDTQQLSVPAGTRGNLLSITDTGSGLVYFTLDGTTPGNTPNGPNKGEVTGPYLTMNLRNVDLSQVRFNGSSTASDYTAIYEKYV